MSRLTYSTVLDERVVKRSELLAMFADVSAYINTPSIDPEFLETSAIRYRHLREPAGYDYFVRKEGAAIHPLALNKAGVWNVTDLVVAHQSVEDSILGRNGAERPPIIVCAEYESYEWPESEYEIGILYSVAGAGGPFNLYLNSNRALGHRHASDVKVICTAPENHYFGLPGGWRPHYAYAKTPCMTCVGVVDIGTLLADKPSDITHFALGIRTSTGLLDVDVWDRATLWIEAADSE